MQLASFILIWVIVWWMVWFAVLSFGLRQGERDGRCCLHGPDWLRGERGEGGDACGHRL